VGEKPVPLKYMVEPPTAPGSAASTTSRATDRFPTSRGDLVVAPLDHASLLFGWDGKSFYVDPTLRAIGGDDGDDVDLPKADVVLLTHGHYDHLDELALSYLTYPGTVVVGPPSIADRVRLGVALREGENATVFGAVVAAVPMYNAERGPVRGLFYHPRGAGNGYVVDFAGARVYVSGDTECTPEVKALERIDVAFLSVSLPTTMGPSEAAECSLAFRPRMLFPYHDRRVDLSGLQAALHGSGIDLRVRNLYPRSTRIRQRGLDGCAHGHFGFCRDMLDRAQYLDPLQESDPDVQRARAQVRAWRAPFPPEW
jgi:L-ascorbate metabolism protein UlaG (beta-lactamase superfamily)